MRTATTSCTIALAVTFCSGLDLHALGTPVEDAVVAAPLELKLDCGAAICESAEGDQRGIRLAMLGESPASAPAGAEQEGGSETAMAKKLQNPVANLISVPIQWNINTGVGPHDDDQNIINVQPVIPIHLNEDWNLITRTILPIISTPVPDWEAGLGDVQLSLFASPAAPSKFIWGAGPIFQFPTATDDTLGQGKWCAGPTVVGLYMDGPWVVGALANQLWSFAGDSDRSDVSQMLVQIFCNYNFEGGWYLTTSPIITANWEADSENTWTLPIGGGGGKVFKLGDQIMNAQVQAFYNVVAPDNGPEWTIRFTLTFVFPQ